MKIDTKYMEIGVLHIIFVKSWQMSPKLNVLFAWELPDYHCECYFFQGFLSRRVTLETLLEMTNDDVSRLMRRCHGSEENILQHLQALHNLRVWTGKFKLLPFLTFVCLMRAVLCISEFSIQLHNLPVQCRLFCALWLWHLLNLSRARN